MDYPITIAGGNLVKCVGNALDYSTPMTSFSPFYSDIGLGFDHAGGIKCLFLHYNRKTTRCFDPFMSIPSSVKGQECSATSVAQLLEDGTAHVAFCDHNTWIVECNGVRRFDFSVSHDSAFAERRCSVHEANIRVFDGYFPTGDARDPDRRFPFVLGLRVIAGEASGSDGITGQIQIAPDAGGRIVLAFSARMLAVDHETLLNRLNAASGSVADAVRRSQAWLEQAMGNLTLTAHDERECSVLSRCVHGLLSNSAAAPGFLSGRVSAFPSRGNYPTHYLWDSCFQNLALEQMHARLAEDSL